MNNLDNRKEVKIMRTYALDIETVANRPDYFSKRIWNDLISIALVNVDNLDEKYEWSLRPPEEYIDTDGWYSGHGMTSDTQKDCKSLKDVWSEICDVLDGNTVVAHNGFGFDMEVFIQSAKHYDLVLPKCKWLDTKYEFIKTDRLIGKESSLANLTTKYTTYDESNHHNALADTIMLAGLYNYMTSQSRFDYVWSSRLMTKPVSDLETDKKLSQELFPTIKF